MHIYSAQKKRIELQHIDSKLVVHADAPALQLKTPRGSSAVTNAARAMFDLGATRGVPAHKAVSSGIAPTVFREKHSGLQRVVYREVVIRFRPGTPVKTCDLILAKFGYKPRKRNAFVTEQIVAYQPNKRRIGEALIEAANQWSMLDEVVFATPNFVSEYQRSALPRIHPEQWHLRNTARFAGQLAGEDVDAKKAWKITRGKRSVVVAVLDDGVDVDHPNLRGRIRRNPDPSEPRDIFGRDFFLPDDHPDHFNPRPKRFQFPFDQMTGNDIHGTPCAGVIAAAGKNNGAVGIAPGCMILPVKVFHADDLASDARVADAIRYAAVHADILSCSWSGGSSPDIELAIEDAGTLGRGGKGAAIFCAAGNGNGRPVEFPARHPEAIAVGASTDKAKRASYSNVGPELWVCAPSSGGVRGIYTADVSADNRGFNVGTDAAGGADGLHTNEFGGTSSATPLAAGVGALMLSAKSKLDRVALKQMLAETAEKIGSGYNAQGHSKEFGFGRVNAATAIARAKSG